MARAPASDRTVECEDVADYVMDSSPFLDFPACREENLSKLFYDLTSPSQEVDLYSSGSFAMAAFHDDSNYLDFVHPSSLAYPQLVDNYSPFNSILSYGIIQHPPRQASSNASTVAPSVTTSTSSSISPSNGSEKLKQARQLANHISQSAQRPQQQSHTRSKVPDESLERIPKASRSSKNSSKPRPEPVLPADRNAAVRAAARAAAAIDPGKGVPGRFQCEFDGCSLAFDRRYNLKTHYRKHTGECPYKCKEPGCGKAYRWRSSAQHHKLAHENAKRKVKGVTQGAIVKTRVLPRPASLAPKAQEQVFALPEPFSRTPARSADASKTVLRAPVSNVPVSKPLNSKLTRTRGGSQFADMSYDGMELQSFDVEFDTFQDGGFADDSAVESFLDDCAA